MRHARAEVGRKWAGRVGEALLAKFEDKFNVHLRVFEDDELVVDLPHRALLLPVSRWPHRVHVLSICAVEAEFRKIF
jgi:hypothetical protein